MPTDFPHRAPSRPRTIRRDSGVALVLTLALIVVATVIVTAFFFRTRYDAQGSAGYSSQVTAAKLAELGSAQVVAALIAEAEDGAAEVVGTGDNRVFVVDDPQKMVVSRRLTSSLGSIVPDPTGGFQNIVKQSVQTADAGGFDSFAEVGINVSDVATYDAALADKATYRPLSGKYWSAPMLTTEEFEDTDVPNWVYVTASGQSTTSVPGSSADDEDKVVGRYAFNVYDVGGLLDMNAAGFTAGSAEEIEGRKGNLVFADLEWLSSQLGSPLDVARLNEWRYRPDVQWTATNGRPSESLSAVLRAGPMFASLGKYPPGLDAIHGTTEERPNQNAFLSRTDLLSYLSNELGDDEALRQVASYLTHFTRDINAPTYQWEWDKRLDVDAGRNDSAGQEEIINSDVWSEDGEILMPRRFALDQIDLLKLNVSGSSPVEDRSAEVSRAFGFEWNGGAERWVYDPDKVEITPAGTPRFRTLKEVKDAGETPNFFEVLQAAIHTGSLGHQLAGVTPVVNPVTNPLRFDRGDIDPVFGSAPNNRPHASALDDSCTAYHIARIGAAIIDQWDEDSLPTELEMNGRVIFGVEDLPYLHGFKRLNYYGVGGRAITNVGQVVEGGTFLHPQVWNPHAIPSAVPNVPRPTKFRVVPYTLTILPVEGGSGKIANNPPTTQPNFAYGTDFGRPNVWPVQHDSANGGLNYQDPLVASRYPGASALGNLDIYAQNGPNPLLNQDTDWIEFEDSESLREPALLWTATGNGVSGDVNASMSGQPGTTFLPFVIDGTKNRTAAADAAPRIGFRVGKYYVNAAPNGNTTGSPWAQIDLLRYRGWAEFLTKVNFALQYQPPGSSDWKIYDIMYDVVDMYTPKNTMTNSTSGLSLQQDQVWRVMGRDHDGTYRIDPRVERFGPQSQFYRVFQGRENLVTSSDNLSYFPPNSTGFSPTGSALTKAFVFRSQEGGQDWRFAGYNHAPRGNGADNVAAIKTQWPVTTAIYPFNQFVATVANRTGVNGVRYLDPDGEQRWGVGGWVKPNPMSSREENPLTQNDPPTDQENRDARPVILNRPFQSVAEMGYACRDLPWKSVDFWNANTGDNALLDYFCINSVDVDPALVANPDAKAEANQLMAGVLNLNSASPLVLEAVIRGTSARADGASGDSMALQEANFTSIATALSNWVNLENTDPDEGPFRSRAEIAGKPISPGVFTSPFSGKFTNGTDSNTPNSSAIKAAVGENILYDSRRTSLMRALVDSVGVRTWNLMIDVTAQTGKLSPQSSSLADFNVDGQARYWIFVAIDRFTGKVIDQRIETVY